MIDFPDSKQAYLWQGAGIKMITATNPLKKGYASFIGIQGKREKVLEATKHIEELTNSGASIGLEYITFKDYNFDSDNGLSGDPENSKPDTGKNGKTKHLLSNPIIDVDDGWTMTPLEYQQMKAIEKAGNPMVLNAVDRRNHEAIVKQAIEDKMAVPKRVLAHYPWLVEKAPKEAGSKEPEKSTKTSALKKFERFISKYEVIDGHLYDGQLKETFETLGKAALKELAEYLGLKEYQVDFEKGHKGVSGGLILRGMFTPDKGVFISIIRGGVTGEDFDWLNKVIIYRSITHIDDAEGGPVSILLPKRFAEPEYIKEKVYRLLGVEKQPDQTPKAVKTDKQGIRSKLSLEEFIKYGRIGFDKLSSYKRSAVNKAKKVMDQTIKLGYAIPYDYGRGKGKYTTTDKAEKMSFDEIFTNVYNNIHIDQLTKVPAKSKYDYLDGVISHLHQMYDNGKRPTKTQIEKLGQELGVPNSGMLWEAAELSWLLWYKGIYNEPLPFEVRLKKMVHFWNNLQPTYAYSDSSKEFYKQYSTPCPIGAMIAQYTGMDTAESIFEPSAGNGLLLVGADLRKTHVNEIDPTRLGSLKRQGFARITSDNAARPFDKSMTKAYDVVVTNPPFTRWEEAKTDKEYIVRKYFNNMMGLTRHIRLEHVMAALALHCMKDNGKAAIIIMGHVYFKDGYFGKYRPFFNWLYRHYLVSDVINLNSFNLYNKQGAIRQTMLILVNGRKLSSKGVAPTQEQAAYLYDMVNSFEELWERIKPHVGDSIDILIKQLKIELDDDFLQ